MMEEDIVLDPVGGAFRWFADGLSEDLVDGRNAIGIG